MNSLATHIWAMTTANIKARYRGTFSGFLWVIINPILIFSAQAVAFHYIVKMNIESFPIFLASGLLPWIFIVQSVEMGTPILLYQGKILKNYQIHPFVFVCSQVLDNALNFVFSSVAVLLLLNVLYKPIQASQMLALVLPICVLVGSIAALVWILSCLQVIFRDLRFINSFVLQIVFYLTPILYPASWIPENVRPLISLNPFYHLILPFQILLIGGTTSEFFLKLANSFAIFLGLATIATFIWRRMQNAVMQRV